MNDVIAVMEAEERRLTDELNRNPIYVQLQAVKTVLQLYKSAAQPMPTATTVRTADLVARPAGPRAGTLAARLRPVILDYLREKGGRAQTTELLKVVTDAGIEIGGKKPSGVLSSYLSNMKEELDHVQGEGYGLKQPDTEISPPAPQAESLVEDGRPATHEYTGGVFGPEYDDGDGGERHTHSEPRAERTEEPEIFK